MRPIVLKGDRAPAAQLTLDADDAVRPVVIRHDFDVNLVGVVLPFEARHIGQVEALQARGAHREEVGETERRGPEATAPGTLAAPARWVAWAP